MLNELKFVQGAVAKKDLLPALTHFRIEGGTVRSFNGTLALCCPIALDIDCTPKAIPFVKAIGNCDETVSMSMTKAGRLSIRSGVFKAFVDCVEVVTPHVVPEGEEFEIDGEALLEALKVITPFIGDDASRPWSNGILLKGQSAYATNNVSLIEYWVGTTFPIICNVPRAAVREMVRINEPPQKAMVNDTSISFLYTDGRWIRTSLLDIAWPDLEKILDVDSNAIPIDERIFDGLDALKPFVDNLERVYFRPGNISTTLIEGEGANYDIEGFDHEGVYQISILNLLRKNVTAIDFTLYPKPCIFYGDKLRGALVGMRV